MGEYTLHTWADGFGVWHCRVDFKHGAGNTAEGARLIETARAAAQKKIRAEIVEREAPHQIRRLKYKIVDNHESSTGQLTSFTIAEDS